VSKARCVQSLGENFAAFASGFIVAFAPTFPAALVSANISATAAIPASAFAFAEWDLDFYFSLW
jgi:hypothetical protein